MAAGFMRQLSDGLVEVFSGGSEPADQVNPVVVTAMAEKGVDISDQQPKPWRDERLRAADVVVTNGVLPRLDVRRSIRENVGRCQGDPR